MPATGARARTRAIWIGSCTEASRPAWACCEIGATGCQHSQLGSPPANKADTIEFATRDEARVIPVPGTNGARMMASISSVEMRGPCRVLVWVAIPRVAHSCSRSFSRASRMSCGLSCGRNQPPLSRRGSATYDEPVDLPAVCLGIWASRWLPIVPISDLFIGPEGDMQ